jgi:hypothetical protein
MTAWLQILGLVKRTDRGTIFYDNGDIADGDLRKLIGERKRVVFLGDASPAKVIEALDVLQLHPRSQANMKSLGYRNACAVLYRFRLIEVNESGEFEISENAIGRPSVELVWRECKKEDSLALVIEKLKLKPLLSPEQIGSIVSMHFGREWKESSWKRVGNGLRQWASWLLTPQNKNGNIPTPPGRTTEDFNDGQESLFSF